MARDRDRVLGLAMLMLVGAGCGHARRARVDPPPRVEHADLLLTVPQIEVGGGAVTGATDAPSHVRVTLEVVNQGAVDVELRRHEVALRLAEPGSNEDPTRLPAARWGTWVDGEAREVDGPTLPLRNGETTRIWLEPAGLMLADPLPRRLLLELELAGRPVTLTLADPSRNTPRWHVAAPSTSGPMAGAFAYSLGRDLGLGLTPLSATRTFGPLTLHPALHLLLPSRHHRPTPTPSLTLLTRRPDMGAGPSTQRPDIGEVYLGGIIGAFEEGVRGAGEVGVAWGWRRGRGGGGTWPVVERSRGAADVRFRVGYVHWFGARLRRWGVPGAVVGLTSAFR